MKLMRCFYKFTLLNKTLRGLKSHGDVVNLKSNTIKKESSKNIENSQIERQVAKVYFKGVFVDL